MRHFLSVLALAGAGTQFVAAQSYDDLLACAKSALQSVDSPGCDDTDIACYCNNPPFVESVKDAIGQACTQEEQTKAISLAQNVCNQVGIPVLGEAPILGGEAKLALPRLPKFSSKERREDVVLDERAYAPEPEPSSAAKIVTATPAPEAKVYPSGSAALKTGDNECTCGSSNSPAPVGHVPAANTPGATPTPSGASPAQNSHGATPFTPFQGAGAQSLPNLVAPLAVSVLAVLAAL